MLKGILSKLKTNLLRQYKRTKRGIGWIVDTHNISKTIFPKSLETINLNGRFLILAPHSDDEWIGCSQIITKCSDTIVCNMNMAGGDSAPIHEQRLKEMHDLSVRFQKQLLSISEPKIQQLSELILLQKPNYILVPFFCDWHPEHMLVMSYLYTAIQISNYKGKILAYQVSVPIGEQICNYCLPMTAKEQKNKWKIFNSIYKTQSFMPTLRFKSYERIMGKLCGMHSCESYVLYDANIWQSVYETNQLSNTELKELKSMVNDIKKCRRYVVELQNRFFPRYF